jgi:hypothetical protein
MIGKQLKPTYFTTVSRSTTKRQFILWLKTFGNILKMISTFGEYHILGLTLTLAPPNRRMNFKAVTIPWNLFATAYLRPHSAEILHWLRLVEPQPSSGIPHIHAVLVCSVPVSRPAYPSELRSDPSSLRRLNPAGRRLKRELLRAAVRSGFGPQSELHPILKTAEKFASYHADVFKVGRLEYPYLKQCRRYTVSRSLKMFFKSPGATMARKHLQIVLKRKETAPVRVIQERYKWLLCPCSHQVCPNPMACGLYCRRKRIRLRFAGKLKHPRASVSRPC